MSEVELLWQPPSAMFHSVKTAIPQTGEIEISLHPAIDFMRAAVESRGATNRDPTATRANGGYRFEVLSMFLYVMETRGPTFTGDRYLLDLDEINAQQAGIASGGLQEIPFTVNRTTRALTAAFIDRRQDTDTRTSRTTFRSYQDKLTQGLHVQSENLKKFVMTYAGRQFPMNIADIEFGRKYGRQTKKQFFLQRYLESVIYRGKMDAEGEVETFQEWMERGYYLHFRVDKDSRDESTRVIVKPEFDVGTNTTNMYLVLFEHHRSIVQVTLTPDRRVLSVLKSDV